MPEQLGRAPRLRFFGRQYSPPAVGTDRPQSVPVGVVIAGQVRSIAIDIVKASEAGETDRGALVEAPTEELLAGLPVPEPANAAP